MTKQYTAEDFKVGDFWETRNGAKHLIIANVPHLNIYYPIIAINILPPEKDGKSRVCIFEYTKNGKYSYQVAESRYDLIRPWREKKRIRGWVNFYPHANVVAKVHPSKADADCNAANSRLACLYIDIEEGEGLETEEPTHG